MFWVALALWTIVVVLGTFLAEFANGMTGLFGGGRPEPTNWWFVFVVWILGVLVLVGLNYGIPMINLPKISVTW